MLDAFHVVKLGNQMVDEVRRRVQQHTEGHRGHKGGPLFEARRLNLGRLVCIVTNHGGVLAPGAVEQVVVVSGVS